jgi:hypothetical protein
MSKMMADHGDFDEISKDLHAARREVMTSYEWDFKDFL